MNCTLNDLLDEFVIMINKKEIELFSVQKNAVHEMEQEYTDLCLNLYKNMYKSEQNVVIILNKEE